MFSCYIVCVLVVAVSIFMNARGVSTLQSTRPNIVLIIADDLGWDDVSFHGSTQVLTPNLDLLAYTGVALERYYSHCVCTPSRAALLTGKYGHVTGMQGYPLTNGEDRGIPLTHKLLPQHLKELGYATHLVGKWHVGGSRTAYAPTSRGFDTHFGHRGGYIDYYEYTNQETWSTGKLTGFDLYRNLTAAWDVEGYITDIYNEESKSIIRSHDVSTPLFLMVAHNAPHSANAPALLQAPPDVVRSMRHVESAERRIYAAMVKKLDDSVGEIMEALLEKGIIDNTIVVFIADNGGMTSGFSMNYASNWPLRGIKFSPFEGGIRVAGLLWTSEKNNSNHKWKGYMHVADWMPTILRAIGAEPPTDIDGIDLWQNIIANEDSKREEMFEINDYFGFHSIISGDYKLVTGNVVKEYSNHQGGDLRSVIGSGPSYKDAIEKSKMYSVINMIGKSFHWEDVDIRNIMRVKCDLTDVKDQDLCYPSASEGKVCLFNIKDDPCELQDLSASSLDIVTKLLGRLETEVKRKIDKSSPLFRDPRAAPSLFNYTWSIWADDMEQ